jgi:pimeloyl-ACP methyl ester carboxylesterase
MGPVAKADLGHLTLDYDVTGPIDGAPLVLVNGLGTQRIRWDAPFVRLLGASGYRVATFDNRDVGRSTWFDEFRVDVDRVMAAVVAGDDVDVPYRLGDMAADVVGLLDHLEIGRAHLMGMSMGGMIVQQTAIDHQSRVASLTSIMSTTGEVGVGGPTGEAMVALMAPSPSDREGYVEAAVAGSKVYAGAAFWDEAYWRDLHGREFDRAYHPTGQSRQLSAIFASGDRAGGLGQLDVPTAVIHGDVDTLIQLDGGERTAQLVPEAELTVVEGMGHELPHEAWPEIVTAMTAVARRAGADLPDR